MYCLASVLSNKRYFPVLGTPKRNSCCGTGVKLVITNTRLPASSIRS
ncbi:Uncharacterised protein [Vibrio cholerae]|nr:Uncharacterised protein [Vibrio cholerae]